MATPDDRVPGKRDRPTNHTPPSGSKKNKAEKCITCKKDAAVDAIECQWCTSWEHKVCANVSKKEYSLLNSASSNILFFCSTRTPKVLIALKTYDVNLKIGSLEQKVTQLCDINNQFGPKLQTIEAMLSTLEKKIQQTELPKLSVPNEEPKKQFTSFMSSFMNEEKEKEKRRLNLIIHNVEESADANSSVRKNHDINLIDSALRQYLGISTKIEKAIRLGKRTDNLSTTKPRLLKITISFVQDKAKILRSCTKLSNRENPVEIQKLFITPDLTPCEQEANKALRTELKELNKEQNLYRIKNGKIVRRENQS